MASVNIDGAQYELKDGDNLLQAVLSERLDLPYFCWHPAMGSVGSCRLCAVIEYADENDERGRLQMACMMPVRGRRRVPPPGHDRDDRPFDAPLPGCQAHLAQPVSRPLHRP
ncbi:MAG: 2Fe-2S iron-sulfur cluster-binding protein [Gammaproteobacteria bacterium]|nr:2Fe-2S iron-sulfur cluster-binding protein [Gammaproteobacteria bacterium]